MYEAVGIFFSMKQADNLLLTWEHNHFLLTVGTVGEE